MPCSRLPGNQAIMARRAANATATIGCLRCPRRWRDSGGGNGPAGPALPEKPTRTQYQGADMPWNYGDILDAVGETIRPDAPAFVHGEKRILWGNAHKRMNNFGRALIERGAKPGDKVAFYLRNGTEYMVATGACYRARLVHVNINYRYRPEEVRYILDNSDAVTLIYGSEFRDTVAQIKDQLPHIKAFIEVGEGEIADFAEDYETLAATGDGAKLDVKRKPEDMLFIYTGGTTGMPKGVMWQHGDLCTLWHERLRRTVGAAPPSIEFFAGAGFAPGLPADARHGIRHRLHRHALRRLRGDGGQSFARFACNLVGGAFP